MRLLWVAAASLLCSVSAQALPAYTQLNQWFYQGQAITINDLDGFYSGRCFAANRPDHATNAMIGYYTRPISENRGPAFPSTHPETKVITVNAPTKPADYFDDEETFPTRQQEFIFNAKESWSRTSHVQSSPTLWWTVDWEDNGNPDEGHAVVRYGDYFIERWNALIDQEYEGWGFHKRGDTLAMCYYFKKMN